MAFPEIHTLVDLLRFRATSMPDRVAFDFEGRAWTYSNLWRQSLEVAVRLQRWGIQPGDRVVIALPNGPGFLAFFFGCQLAGVVAVPVFPGSSPKRCRQFLDLSGGRLLILPRLPEAASLDAYRALAPHLMIWPPEEELEGETSGLEIPPVVPSDIAFIQFTSGTTYDPKGVMLSHHQLLTNVRQMIEGMQITTEDVFVSWLPVYHDMGLILKVLVPFYLGLKLVLLPASLQQVHNWLGAIEQHRGTFTAAPDFGYRLAIRWMQAGHQYDLSSLRVALNAAEPVRLSTFRDFTDIIGREGVMVAGYGLAEATVGVSMMQPGLPPVVDDQGHVSVGHPFPGITLAILKGDQLISSGTPGEILLDSPANTVGYYQNPAATAALFWKGKYLRTGDVGYLDATGRLFVMGRIKNVIKLAGRSIYAADIEESVESLPRLRHVAAIGVEGGMEGERLIIFAETPIRPEAAGELKELAIDIVQRVFELIGVRPARVYLVRRKTIPFTFNGKKQHNKLKKWFLEGKLWNDGQIIFPDF